MAERAAAEDQLRQAQKMEAVGQLTGGIAHDFNNMLAVVVGGLELAQRWLADAPDKAQRHIHNALDGANRAADLTRRLLAFARSEPARPEMMVVDDSIAAFAELIERTIGDRIALTLDLQAPGLACWLDRQQFENALLNLAVNARDAMEGHGSLTIRTLRDEEEEAAALAVQVIDTGCGMSPEVLERVFDPFYTTKPAGQGTGLGMSQVFAFCRQSEGEVQIQSAEGEGTRVAMLLPVARPPAAIAGRPPRRPGRRRGGGERRAADIGGRGRSARPDRDGRGGRGTGPPRRRVRRPARGRGAGRGAWLRPDPVRRADARTDRPRNGRRTEAALARSRGAVRDRFRRRRERDRQLRRP